MTNIAVYAGAGPTWCWHAVDNVAQQLLHTLELLIAIAIVTAILLSLSYMAYIIAITVIHGIPDCYHCHTWHTLLSSTLMAGSRCNQHSITTKSSSVAKSAVANHFAFVIMRYRLTDIRFTAPCTLTPMLQAAWYHRWKNCLCAKLLKHDFTTVVLSIKDRRPPLHHDRHQSKLSQHHIIFF